MTCNVSVEGAFPFLPAPKRDVESRESAIMESEMYASRGERSPTGRSDSSFSSDDTRLLDPSKRNRPIEMLTSCLPLRCISGAPTTPFIDCELQEHAGAYYIHRPALAKWEGQVKTTSGAPLGPGGRDYTRIVAKKGSDSNVCMGMAYGHAYMTCVSGALGTIEKPSGRFQR